MPTIVLLLGLALSPPAETAPGLRLEITGLVSETAPVRAALFGSKAGWDGEEPPLRTAVLEPSDGACTWALAGLAPGELALRVFQDLDGDGELDRDERGRPREPYGFSGSRKGLFGPPGWKKVRFELGAEPLVLEVELRSRGEQPDEDEQPPG